MNARRHTEVTRKRTGGNHMIGPCAKRAKKAAARKATFDFLRLPRAVRDRIYRLYSTVARQLSTSARTLHLDAKYFSCSNHQTRDEYHAIIFGETRFNIWVGPVLPKVIAKLACFSPRVIFEHLREEKLRHIRYLSVHGPLGDFTIELFDTTVADNGSKKATTKRMLTRAVANKNSTHDTDSVHEKGNEGAIYVRAVAARKKLETDETILCLCKHLGNLIEDRNEWSLGADDWTDAVDICKGADREYGYGELGR
ncbi:hypothetical protein LTR66_005391 [Elasticomyces elasticus]|nr:hypothetical protein LTR66_005391 [Elasticomyces elasticus]